MGDADALGAAIKSSLATIRSRPAQLRSRIEYDLRRYDRSAAVASVLDFYGEAIAKHGIGASRAVDLELAATHV